MCSIALSSERGFVSFFIVSIEKSLSANTDPQRDSILTKRPADVLNHATSEIAIGTKLGIDATRKLAGEGFKRPWPPLIKMSEEVRRKIDALFKTNP